MITPRKPVRNLSFKLITATTLLVVSVSCNASAQQPTSVPPPATIHVDVERVNVGALVIDSRGKFVEGLHRGDFHVFDNSAEQPITDFASSEEPGQVLFLIEAGP